MSERFPEELIQHFYKSVIRAFYPDTPEPLVDLVEGTREYEYWYKTLEVAATILGAIGKIS